MSYQKENFIRYLQRNGNVNPGAYCNGLDNIERILQVDIEEEFKKDSCNSLYTTLQEIRKHPEQIGKTEPVVRQYASRLKQYATFRQEQETGKTILVEINNNVEPSTRVNHALYGFEQITAFLANHSGKHYITPDRAGDQAEFMSEIRLQGQDARKRFVSFTNAVAESLPGLEYASCSNWVNQGQVIEQYIWAELKNKKWKDYPQSVSISIATHDESVPGEGQYISIRTETRDVSSTDADYKRQFRLLDCKLLDGMVYLANLKNGKHYFGTDHENIKRLCDDGAVKKLEVVEIIEDLPQKDKDGTILDITIKAAKEIQALYEYVMDEADDTDEEWWPDLPEYDHNMILYGPPGTGKTYNSVIYAVAICEGRPIENVMQDPYSDILIRYRGLQNSGRIAFTTFHQSYGYEEFIEGIKPRLNSESETLGYTIEDGVFKDFCNRAKAVKVQNAGGAKMKQNPRIWGMILGGTGMTELKKHCFANNEIRLGWSEVDDEDVDGDFLADEKISWNAKHMVSDFKNTMEIGDLIVTEKSNKSIDAIGVITGEYEYDKEQGRYPRKRAVEWLVKDIDQDMVPFLPKGRRQLSRFSLFAFDYIGMDAISQILNENSYTPVIDVEQESKPYVFIIDEINRGNISKIFGELITLIEDTKRAGASEAMEAILPYSGETFSVPKNVYILGTMNTADRSIALMDTALRRRFEFTEMMPNSKILESLGIGTIAVDGQKLNIGRMLDIINERIEYLFDREHTIGHAYFTRLVASPSIETLASIFEKNVIPLLQEYFYEDYEKIQLVLGDNAKEDEFKFVLDKPLKIKDVFSGNPDIDLPEKAYVIQKEALYKLESYKQIGKDI